jgi:two-component system response regulator RegA
MRGEMAQKQFDAVLVIEDHRTLARALADHLAERATDVVICASVAEARDALASKRVELVLLDVALPDGDAFDVLHSVMAAKPAPAVIAISGGATSEQSFRLAEFGVRAYLSKPIDSTDLHQAIDAVVSHPPRLDPLIRGCVGRARLSDVEEQVRSLMVSEAMARSCGSRRRAAAMLSVSRQMLQHVLRKLGC